MIDEDIMDESEDASFSRANSTVQNEFRKDSLTS